MTNYYKNFLHIFILIVVTIALGVGLFMMKYKVRNLERELKEINKEISLSEQKIRLLKGEWTRLNSAVRIKKLVSNNMAPINYRRIIMLSDIPLKAGMENVHTVSYKE